MNFLKWANLNPNQTVNINYELITEYIIYLADNNYKSASIQRKIAAIKKVSDLNNIEIVGDIKAFKLVWQGIRRKLGIAKTGKDPILVKTLKLMLSTIPQDIMGIRDKVLLSFGWASAMRRSEIVNLNWNDLKFIEEGITVRIKNSKTDKFGQGEYIAILYARNKEYCPVRLLHDWKNISMQRLEDPIFTSLSKSGKIKGLRLSPIDVARIVKKYAVMVGLDEALFTGHSLRSGLITTASKNSVSDHVIMKHSRHKTAQMIHVYTREKSLIEDNVTGLVGL